MPKINTFSENSLKILDKDPNEFKNRYEYSLFLLKKDKRAQLGQKFHSLICSYIRGFDTDKMSLELNEREREIWQKLKTGLSAKKNNFIKTEYSFLIKEKLNDDFYYLTGRFDAIYQDKNGITVYDWKTLNTPKDPENDLQSVVYLYCANKIFKKENIKLRYLSIEKLNFADVEFKNSAIYKKRTDEIVKKYYELFL